MADWTNPTPTSQYISLLDILKERDFDAAVMFSPLFSTATNLPEGTQRWNNTSNIWEIRDSGGTWVPLTTLYQINVAKLGGQAGSYYLNWDNFTNKPTSFTPSAHNHDDRYYTETESDSRFAAVIDANGNNLRLKSPSGTVLSTVQAPYATSAGNAAKVSNYFVGQNLRPTDAATFAGLSSSAGATVYGGSLNLGADGEGNSELNFYDDTNDTWRFIRWSDTVSDWVVEDSTGTAQRMFHGGHLPTWSEVAGKPTSFAPEAHGHNFDATNRLQLRSATATAHNSLTGVASELTYQSTDKRLIVHDGSTVGGRPLAFVSDIPAPSNLSNYARKDQAETFASTLGVTGKLTAAGQVQMLSGRIVDTSAAGSSKVMLSIEGDSDALQVINYGTGDYAIVNSQQQNGLRIFDGDAGVSLRVANTTKIAVTSTGVEIFDPFLVQGNTVWHAGNDGAGSNLDADKLDGREATGFLQREPQSALDLDAVVTGVHGASTSLTNGPAGMTEGTLLAISPTSGAPGFQMASSVEGEFFLRYGNSGPGGNGTWDAWDKIWHTGNHGATSGLDADLLDGLHAASFLRKDTSNVVTTELAITGTSDIGASTWNNGWFKIGTATKGWAFDDDQIVSANVASISSLIGNFNITSGTGGSVNITSGTGGSINLVSAGDINANGFAVLTEDDEGTLDAGFLDGYDSTQFLRSDINATLSEDLWVKKDLQIGSDVHGHSTINFWDDNSDDWRTFRWHNSSNDWYVESASGVMGRMWHENNDGPSSGLNADLVDGLEAAQFLRSDESDTIYGDLDVYSDTPIAIVLRGSSPAPETRIGMSFRGRAGIQNQTGLFSYDFGNSVSQGHEASFHFESEAADIALQIPVDSDMYRGNDRFYHDAYHPTADVLSTARTVTVIGDDIAMLGSAVTFDGSANIVLDLQWATGGSKVLTKILGYDGAGSFLDADFLDGQHGNYYLDCANFTGTLRGAVIPFATLLAPNDAPNDLENTTDEVASPALVYDILEKSEVLDDLQAPRFESAEVSFAQLVTINHGMGRVPRQVRAVLRCKVASGGYAVGDEIEVSGMMDGDGSRGYSMWSNDTYVKIFNETTSIQSTTGGYTLPTSTHWKYVVYTW
jgi:hypothetical protein